MYIKFKPPLLDWGRARSQAHRELQGQVWATELSCCLTEGKLLPRTCQGNDTSSEGSVVLNHRGTTTHHSDPPPSVK